MTAPPTTNRVESYRHLPNAEWPQLPIIRSLWHRIESNRNELDKQQPTKRLVTAKGGKLSVEENNGQYEGGVTYEKAMWLQGLISTTKTIVYRNLPKSTRIVQYGVSMSNEGNYSSFFE
ncbi:hypothetical protein BLOT_016086 [Blomia tropicalis]|nr:hypothetical protein BLOT_016086 [Blomia tropicalis]